MDNYKQVTIASYDQFASSFAQKFNNLTDLLRRSEFSCFLQALPGKRVLDVGCGAGDHALFFQQQGLQVTAIDLSSAMVRLALQKGVDARVMDLENLLFPNNSFDGIWAVTSLLHVPKNSLPAVIKQLHALLRERGVLYVCVKEGVGERMVVKDGEGDRFFAFWQREELLSLFENFERLVFREERVVLGNAVFLQF